MEKVIDHQSELTKLLAGKLGLTVEEFKVSNEDFKLKVEKEDRDNVQKTIEERNEAISKREAEKNKQHTEYEKIMKEAETHGVNYLEMVEIKKRKEAILSERRIEKVVNEFVKELDDDAGENIMDRAESQIKKIKKKEMLIEKQTN